MNNSKVRELSTLLGRIEDQRLEYIYTKRLTEADTKPSPKRHWETMWWLIKAAPIDIRIRVAKEVLYSVCPLYSQELKPYQVEAIKSIDPSWEEIQVEMSPKYEGDWCYRDCPHINEPEPLFTGEYSCKRYGKLTEHNNGTLRSDLCKIHYK